MLSEKGSEDDEGSLVNHRVDGDLFVRLGWCPDRECIAPSKLGVTLAEEVIAESGRTDLTVVGNLMISMVARAEVGEVLRN